MNKETRSKKMLKALLKQVNEIKFQLESLVSSDDFGDDYLCEHARDNGNDEDECYGDYEVHPVKDHRGNSHNNGKQDRGYNYYNFDDNCNQECLTGKRGYQDGNSGNYGKWNGGYIDYNNGDICDKEYITDKGRDQDGKDNGNYGKRNGGYIYYNNGDICDKEYITDKGRDQDGSNAMCCNCPKCNQDNSNYKYPHNFCNNFFNQDHHDNIKYKAPNQGNLKAKNRGGNSMGFDSYHGDYRNFGDDNCSNNSKRKLVLPTKNWMDLKPNCELSNKKRKKAPVEIECVSIEEDDYIPRQTDSKQRAEHVQQTYPDNVSYSSDQLPDICKQGSLFEHLLTKHMKNVVFVYEELNNGYEENNTGGQLDKEGVFPKTRWSFLKQLHLVFQHPTKVTVTICKNANQCHYQILFRELINNLIRYPNTIEVKTYWPNESHESDFIVVKNDIAKHWTCNLNWESLDSLYTFANDETSSSIERQRIAADFGYTSSMCTSRANSLSGVSMPVRKPGTQSEKVVKCFSVINQIASDIELPWILMENQKLYIDDVHPHRHHEFASKIFENNKIEYIRINDTRLGRSDEEKSLCAPHNDAATNSTTPSMATIINVSKLIKDGTTRRNIGCAQRKSIDSFLRSKTQTSSYTGFLINYVQSTPEWRITLNEEIFSKGRVEPGLIIGTDAVFLNSHLNTGVFHSGYMYSMLLLCRHFQLSIPEIVSSFLAIAQLPNSAVFFSKAVFLLVRGYNLNSFPDRLRGFRMGFLLQKLVGGIYGRRTTKDGKSAFKTYRQARFVQDYGVWKTLCKRILSLCLHTWASFKESKSADTKRRRYSLVYNLLHNYLPECGVPIENHIIGMMSAIGILPHWMQQECYLDHDSKMGKFFRSKFQLESKTQSGYQRYVCTLQKALENNLGYSFSMRIIENLKFKVFRCLSSEEDGTRNHYQEFVTAIQPVYSYESSGIGVVARGRSKVTVSSLIERFPFDGDQLTMDEIIGRLNIHKDFPSNEMMWITDFGDDIFEINVAPIFTHRVPYPRLPKSNPTFERLLTDTVREVIVA